MYLCLRACVHVHVGMYVCMHACMAGFIPAEDGVAHNQLYCCTGVLRLPFSREELTTDFPVALGSAKDLGIFDSSFTAMAWVYYETKPYSGSQKAIFGTDERSNGKGLHLQVCLSTQTEFTLTLT